MFFKIHTPEDFKRMHGQASKTAGSPTSEEPTGPQIYVAADGGIIIDDPSIVSVVGVSPYVYDKEQLDRTSVWMGNAIDGSGHLGAWVPLSSLKEWREGNEPGVQ